MSKEQREYMLRQQLRAIQQELGDKDPEKADIQLLRERFEKSELSEEAIGLGKQLASESQLADVMAGEGTAIIGAGTGRALNDAQRLATEYGGSASDWAKVSSSTYKAKDGSIIEVHACQNIRTGKVVEAKSVSSSFPRRQ